MLRRCPTCHPADPARLVGQGQAICWWCQSAGKVPPAPKDKNDG